MSRQFYSKRNFKVNDSILIECSTQDTSYGFRHVADVYIDGVYIDRAKCCYYNRTWEAWEYQSVLKAVADRKSLSGAERNIIADYARQDHNDSSDLRIISGIMALGDVLATDKKDSNDWKTRMLKAGLEGRGLDMPEDWDQLSEDEKEKRLNGVIATLGEN